MITLKDLVVETTTTTGIGTYNLGGPTSGFRSFSVAGNGAKVPYIVTDGTNFEIGVGTVTVGTPNLLARTTILQSSNANAAVNWGVGTRMIRLAQLGPFTASKDENLNYVDYMGAGGGTANAHTVTLNPAPLGYSDGMLVMYRATIANTTVGMTVNVNNLGAKSLKINGADPAIGQIGIGTLVVGIYKTSNNTIEAINSPGVAIAELASQTRNLTIGLNELITTVASAATPDIWTSTGNVINYTGTTTATGFATAPQAGTRRTLVCAAACQFNNGANMIINGNANYTAAAGDIINVIAVTTTQFKLEPVRIDGKPLSGSGLSVSSNYMYVRDEKPSGTSGGTPTASTFNIRTLNTIVSNTIAGATLSSNKITLPAGTYYIRGRAPAFNANSVKPRIYNVTDAVYLIEGSSNSITNTQLDTHILGQFTIAGTKDIEYRMYYQTASGNGLGIAVSQGVEVYAELEIWKVA